jgi:endonuclease-3
VTTISASVEAVWRLLPRVEPPDPPLAVLDQLVATVLSQHTSDRNSNRAFAALRRRFPSWEAVLAADRGVVADSIRCGGIAERKAATIHSLLREIERREGRLDLERLRDLADREVESYLTSLPGVGPKTAACVLLFAMGRPALPVDTHVHRVTTRLGWVPVGTTAERAHLLLAEAVPRHLRRDLHLALVAHGRQVCTARRPRCSECVLHQLCPGARRST